MRTFFSRLFLILGFLLLIGAGGLTAYNLWEESQANASSQQVIGELQAAMSEELYDTDESDWDTPLSEVDSDIPLYQQFPDMEMPTVTIGDYRYIGVLNVPSLDLELPVMEEWSYPRLRISPCRYTGSAYTDDLTICGHNYARHFGQLHDLEAGTVITFTDMAGNLFHYEVAVVDILEPTAIEAMTVKDEAENDWDMTLFTCTLGGKSRYAIRCIRTE